MSKYTTSAYFEADHNGLFRPCASEKLDRQGFKVPPDAFIFSGGIISILSSSYVRPCPPGRFRTQPFVDDGIYHQLHDGFSRAGILWTAAATGHSGIDPASDNGTAVSGCVELIKDMLRDHRRTNPASSDGTVVINGQELVTYSLDHGGFKVIVAFTWRLSGCGFFVRRARRFCAPWTTTATGFRSDQPASRAPRRTCIRTCRRTRNS